MSRHVAGWDSCSQRTRARVDGVTNAEEEEEEEQQQQQQQQEVDVLIAVVVAAAAAAAVVGEGRTLHVK